MRIRPGNILKVGCLLGVAALAWGATVKTPAPVPAAPPKAQTSKPSTQVAATSKKAPKPAYLAYSYRGDRYRDPFLPLIGSGRGDLELDRPPNAASLLLKGIIQDTKSRLALLTSGANSYILRGGRLYDGRNRKVKGISGVIKPQSVLIVGKDRTVREIRLKKAL